MRLRLTAIGILLVTGTAAAEPPTTAGSRPRQAAAPLRPALQTPADTASAMPQGERQAIQSDLAWVGQYNGAITGEVSERMVAAIKDYQKALGGKPTGVLNPQERGVLADTARRRQENAGWKILTDPGSGTRLGIPTRLVPQQSSDVNGVKWSSPTGTIQVLLTRRKETDPSTAKLAEREKKEPAGRAVDYTVVKPDFFVLSGLQGLKKFYVRGSFRRDEVRVLTILYDQATENTVEPVVIAMSSAFNPFPTTAPLSGPPPRKTVEYGSGVVVTDDGAIVADRDLTDGCLTIAISGHGHADRVAEDRERGLALLRIYGARGLKPLNLSDGAAKPGVEKPSVEKPGVEKSSVELTGIADPQSQGGQGLSSRVKASVQAGSGNDLALTPAPALGFSGAAALDADGRFAGVAVLRSAQLAGPANAVPATQAILVTGDAVRDFLAANGVEPATESSDAAAALVRVICVRK